MTLQAYKISEVVMFELNWKFDKLYLILKTYFKWAKNENSVGIEMNIFALSKEFPINITGFYCGTQEKLLKYLEPFLNLIPSKYKIWQDSYLNSVRHFTYETFPAPYFKNKSYFIYHKLPKTIVPIIKKYMEIAGPNDRIEIDCMGSSYKKSRTSFVHRDAIMWMQFITRWGLAPDNHYIHRNKIDGWMNEEIGTLRIDWVNSFYKDLKIVSGNSLKGAYVGCFDSDIKNHLEEYYGCNVSKLKKIKEIYDPKRVFYYPQSL